MLARFLRSSRAPWLIKHFDAVSISIKRWIKNSQFRLEKSIRRVVVLICLRILHDKLIASWKQKRFAPGRVKFFTQQFNFFALRHELAFQSIIVTESAWEMWIGKSLIIGNDWRLLPFAVVLLSANSECRLPKLLIALISLCNLVVGVFFLHAEATISCNNEFFFALSF